MSRRRADQVRDQVALLAADVGRLRAHLPDQAKSHVATLAERVATRVESLDGLTWPTAADIYRYFIAEGADEDAAVSAALDATDVHANAISSALRLRQ